MFSVKKFKSVTPKLLREPIQRLRGKSIYHSYYNEHKCIFIHIPKAAGQSVSLALFNDKHPGHWSITDFEWENKGKLNKYYKFTIVRNPWDRLVSAYHYLKNTTPYEADKSFARKNLSEFESFESFVLNGLERPEVLNWVHFRPQISFLKNEAGKLDINFIGRLENLTTDFRVITEELQMNGISLPDKTNVSQRDSYKLYYTEEMIDIVRRVYNDDVNEFDYEF